MIKSLCHAVFVAAIFGLLNAPAFSQTFYCRNPYHTDDSLALCLLFDEGPGAHDFSRFDHQVGVSNATWVADTKTYSLNGVDAWLEVPYDASIDADPFTIAFWIMPNNWTAMTHIVSKKSGNNGYVIYYNGTLNIDVGKDNPSDRWDTGLTLSAGVWTHVAYVYNSPRKVYINGSLAASNSKGTNPTVSEPLRIGRGSGTDEYFFNGQINDVAYFQRVLSDQEVLQLYQLREQRKP